MYENISVISKNVCLNVKQPYTNRYKDVTGKSFDLIGEKEIHPLYYDFQHMTNLKDKYTKSDPNDVCDGSWSIFAGQTRQYVQKVPTQPHYKYMRRVSKNRGKCVCHERKKLAILLPELHANLNVGHSARDFLFLSNILSFVSPDVILVEDKAAATGYLRKHRTLQIRQEILSVLVENRSEIIFLQENANPNFANYKMNMCFDHIIQKPLAYSGSKNGNELFRSRMMKYCKVPTSMKQDIILFAAHGRATDLVSSRRFSSQNRLLESLRSLRSACDKSCEIIEASFSDASLCKQVRMYSRARIVIAHHGANMANSMFMQANSLVIEINKQCDEHVLSNSGYGLLHASLGISYIGARVTYMKNTWYDFRSNKLIHINYSKWNYVLNQARTILQLK